MSLARNILLRASRSAWLADELRRRAFFRRATKRFMPGETLDDALGAAAGFAAVGIGTLLTELGEQVTTAAETEGVRDHYLEVMRQVRSRGLPAQISVKLTHLGLDRDRDLCARHLRHLLTGAEQSDSFVWIDMEESRYVDATLALFRTARAQSDRIGVCLQAYLRRTPTDLEALLPVSPTIRLVKGAYSEPPSVALPSKRDVDAQYFTLASRMLEHRAAERVAGRPTLPVFGTHDTQLIERLRDRAKALAIPRDAWEVHMLYGIRSEDQRRLAADACTVRVLISYGSAWFAWYMRRLAERPANVWFVMRNLI